MPMHQKQLWMTDAFWIQRMRRLGRQMHFGFTAMPVVRRTVTVKHACTHHKVVNMDWHATPTF